MANRSNFAEPGTGTGTRTKNFKLAAGSNRYRIGPAYASMAASGRWNVQVNQHYGYKSEENEQGKSFIRTFVCPKVVDKKTEMITVPCAECADTEALAEKVELSEQKLVAQGKDEEEIATILGPQKTYLKEHNLDKKHLVLAKNESNEWGVLWLPWKALEALLNRRKKILSEDGVDILSTKDGCWVDFTREGEGFRNTVYGCDVVTEIVVMENGKKAKMPKQEALEDADFDAIEATCPDLSTVGTRLTPEQIERLVESRGDPEIVDIVFGEAYETKKERSPKPVAKAPPKKVVEEEDIPEEKIMKAAPKPAPKVEAKVEVEVKADEDDEEAVLAAQLAAIKAKKAAKAAAAFKPLPADVEVSEKPLRKVPPVEEPQAELSPDVDPDKLPDDQFVSVFGKRK